MTAPPTVRELTQVALTDGRIRLRSWQVADATALTELCRDPDIRR
jgi:hypothetical protein